MNRSVLAMELNDGGAEGWTGFSRPGLERAFRTAARIGVNEALPNCQPVLLEPIHVVQPQPSFPPWESRCLYPAALRDRTALCSLTPTILSLPESASLGTLRAMVKRPYAWALASSFNGSASMRPSDIRRRRLP